MQASVIKRKVTRNSCEKEIHLRIKYLKIAHEMHVFDFVLKFLMDLCFPLLNTVIKFQLVL